MIQKFSLRIDAAVEIRAVAWQRVWLCLGLIVVFAVAVPACIAADEQEHTVQQRVRVICRNLQRATVRIRSGSDVSSGVIVSRSGLILTVAHGLMPDGAATVIFPSGRSYEAHRIIIDESSDVALLSIKVESLTEADRSFVPLSPGENSIVGEIVLASGFPAREPDGNRPVVRLGEILAIDASVITSSCALTSGDSGGPLVNSRGEVIGLNWQIGVATASNGHIARPVIQRVLERTEHWNTLAHQVRPEPTSILMAKAMLPPSAVLKAARRATVEILGKDANGVLAARACGTVLDDHHIAAKLSEIVFWTALECRFADGTTIGVMIHQVPFFDLAILTLRSPYQSGYIAQARRAKFEDAVSLFGDHEPLRGQIVFSATGPTDVSAAGIISRERHKEPGGTARFGATMMADGERIRIAELSPNGCAVMAGLLVGDELLRVDGRIVTSLTAVGNLLKVWRPGDWTSLDVKRGEMEFRVHAQLQHDPGQKFEKAEFLDGRSGRVSQRRDGFHAALQHDIAIDPAACGGPLFDVEGRLIAVNIARRGRESTLAIPIEVVLDFAQHVE